MAYRASTLTCNTKLSKPDILTDTLAPVYPVTYPPPSLYKFVLQFTSGIVRRKEMLRNMFRGSVFGICMFGVRCSKSQVSTGNILLCIKYYRFMLIVVWNYFYLLKKFSLNASWNTIMIKILRVLIWHLSGKLWNILIK